MPKKMLGAILLPLPFAALPVLVVLIGAAFGPGESEDLVTQTTTGPAPIDQLMWSDAPGPSNATVASVSTSTQSALGCEGVDLSAEF